MNKDQFWEKEPVVVPVSAVQDQGAKVVFDQNPPKKFRYTIGRPRKYKTPEDFLARAEEYLQSCYNDKNELIQPISITGMCNFLGTTRARLLEYENGDLESLKDGAGGDSEGFRNAIKRVKHICEQYAEEHGFQARNPAFAIFALKNYGWKDTQTIETTNTEIHTVDPEVKQLIGEYMRQLSGAQKHPVIDIEVVPVSKAVVEIKQNPPK